MGNSMQNHRTNDKPKHVPLSNILKQRKMESQQNQNFGNVNYQNNSMNGNYNGNYGNGFY